MNNWYVQVNRLIRDIRDKASEAHKSKNKTLIATITGYLRNDLTRLKEIWPVELGPGALSNLGRHIHFGMKGDFNDIIEHDLPEIEAAAEKHFLASPHAVKGEGIEVFLHPIIIAASYPQFQAGQYRDAVLNSIIGLCDHIRKVTGIKKDGAALVNDVFGGDTPLMIFSETDTESGKKDQAGLHKIFLGACQGIRNPKAHSLDHDLTKIKAAQYLVFASLLARRVDEAKRSSVKV
jgi:uncharacterized protein (TIGR02391 family)